MTSLDELLQELLTRRVAAVDAHDALRSSGDYTACLKNLGRMTFGFCQAMTSINIAESRNPRWQHSVLRLSCNDFIQSALTIHALVREGFLEPPRRELRYMLERCVACVYIDQNNARVPIDGRVAFFEVASRNFQGNADQIQLTTLHQAESDYRSALKSFYSLMCSYVHPSASQVLTQLRREENGHGPGFESLKLLRASTATVRQGLDLILATAMQGINAGTLGDLFVDVWDSDERWPFHKTKYINLISACFDHKMERS